MRLNLYSFLALFLLGSCGKRQDLSEFKGMTMGTTYSVKVASRSSYNKEHVKRQISDILKKVNKQMSTYIEDSDITKFNSLKVAQKPFSLDRWFYEVLSFSLSVADKTAGAYDPTVGPLVNLWGFGPSEKRSVPSEDDINKLKESVGYKKLEIHVESDSWSVEKKHPDVYIDLSSTAKGFAVDKISDFLVKEGLDNFFVEVGGEIRAKGKKFDKDWLVAIERPEVGMRAAYKSFPLSNMSIATSGNYRNFFESGGKTYSHTINASTGRPVEHVMVSATVLDKECMKADAYATAVMVLGPEKAKKFAEKENLAVYFIYKKAKALKESIESESFATFSSSAFKAINPMIN